MTATGERLFVWVIHVGLTEDVYPREMGGVRLVPYANTLVTSEV